ncbi:peptidoglycan-binding protein [Streptomyces sp. NPDC020917]|uniref:peptidoglycan-binding domain-containing protein n=1 Tax=Streptomyces sp. NPDC020917 TaxID=3365102 RepID=UPI003792FF31
MEVIRAPHAAGDEPPDVIEVVFPSGPAAPAPDPAPGPPAARGPVPSHRSRREESRERPLLPLLLGGLALVGVALAVLLAWDVWPRYPAAQDVYRPLPAPSYAPLPLPHTATPVQKRAATPAGTPRRTTSQPPSDLDGTGAAPPPAAPSGTPPRTAPATPTASPSGPPAPTATAPRTLRAGDAGSDVRELQQLLFTQGFTYVSVTGVYDAATVRGVTQVQQDRGLTCDPRGVYGPCTRAALTS